MNPTEYKGEQPRMPGKFSLSSATSLVILVWGLLLSLTAIVNRAQGQSVEEIPENVIVVANSSEPQSLELAEYYMDKRGIPSGNLILLSVQYEEQVDWKTFIETIYNPLTQSLLEQGFIDGMDSSLEDTLGRRRFSVVSHRISHLVLCRGIPVKIAHSGEYAEKAPQSRANSQVKTLRASVDGELSLLAYPDNNPLGFTRNPLFPNFANTGDPSLVIRVARLDGPSWSVAKGLVDLALKTEAMGLRGRAYVDMGFKYKQGEVWLGNLGHEIDALGFDLKTERTPRLFARTDRFDAPVLYFGWYAENVTGPFTNAGFRFPPGAIAVHIHSFSASTLNNPGKNWCGPLLARGATATLGNVYEPFLPYTHHLDIFFSVLKEGTSLGEAAYRSLPYLGWQAIVIGDPLYRPFNVSLRDQIARIEDESSDSLYDQYAVIRQMKLLLNEKGQIEALQLGKDMFHKAPGLALAYSIGIMSANMGKEKECLDYLEFARHLSYLGPDEWFLALEIADLLQKNGRTQAGLEIYTHVIESPGLPEEMLKSALRSGIKVSSRTGNLSQSLQWQNQLEKLR